MTDYKSILEAKKAEVKTFYAGDENKAKNLIDLATQNGQAAHDLDGSNQPLEMHIVSSLQGLLRSVEVGIDPFGDTPLK